MLIFGSYMEKDQRLFGEVVNITVLDTVVALMAGFIIIPACFAYGIEPNRPKPYIYHDPEYFRAGGRRACMGRIILPVLKLRCIYDTGCGI